MNLTSNVMNDINTQLFRKETMRRVYGIFLMKKLYGRIAVKTYILLGLVYIQAKLIFVKAVFANMPSIADIPAVYQFYSYAFLNTRAMVQIVAVVALITLLWLFRDLFHLALPSKRTPR